MSLISFLVEPLLRQYFLKVWHLLLTSMFTPTPLSLVDELDRVIQLTRLNKLGTHTYKPCPVALIVVLLWSIKSSGLVKILWTPSGDHECLYKIFCQSVMWMLSYFTHKNVDLVELNEKVSGSQSSLRFIVGIRTKVVDDWHCHPSVVLAGVELLVTN